MLLIGLFLMVTRSKAITQILALLTVENAVFLVAVGVTSGMPLVVELGISFDVILAVLVLGILVAAHRRPLRVDGRQPALEAEGVGREPAPIWTLWLPLVTAAPRRAPRAALDQGGHPRRRPVGDVRPVPSARPATSWRAPPPRRSAMPCASTASPPSSSCCAASSVCCRVPTAWATCGGTTPAAWSRRGCRREFYALVPRLRLRDAARLRLEQSRHPLDRRRADDPGVGIPGRVPQPRHLARGGVEVPDARQPRPRLRAPGDGALFASGRGRLGEGMAALHWTRFIASARELHPFTLRLGRRLRADRIRHEGRPRADAYVEARCLPRSAVAGRRADGGRHAERRVVLPAPRPSDLEGGARPRVLGRPAADARSAVGARRRCRSS